MNLCILFYLFPLFYQPLIKTTTMMMMIMMMMTTTMMIQVTK